MASTVVLVVLLGLSVVVNAVTHELWWNISYTTANPDNQFQRRVIGINGTWPPPPVDISSNDTLVIHAYNGLDQPSSLHHHGMFFNGTSWADGAVGVTQCGIPPGQSFTYTTAVQNWNQWGTYWIHAHSLGQYADGLRTPFIIHNANGEVHADKYDEEYTVIIADWYHTQHADLVAHFISEANPGGAEPVPDSAIIYFLKNNTYLPPLPNTVQAQVGFGENTTLPFEAGKTYRLRVINTSAFSQFFFWIEGHDMRVIEVDGTDIQETPLDILSITVAQRLSILITARNDTSNNWAIHADMDTDMFDTIPPGLNPNATSSITYSPSAPLSPLSTTPPPIGETNDFALYKPFLAEPALPPPQRIINLNVWFDTMDDGTNRAMFNNVTYVAPLVPSLLTEMTMGQEALDVRPYGPQTQAYVLEPGEVVELRVWNWDAGKHPFHLHGHKFQVIYKSLDTTSDDPSVNPPQPNTNNTDDALIPANPLRRDTIQIPSLGTAWLRFRSDNPGAWFFHCHIDWHLSAGLAITLLASPLLLQQDNPLVTPPPPSLAQQCSLLGLPTTGNAAGHASLTDFSGLHEGPFPQRNGWRPRGIGAMVGCVASAIMGWAGVVWYSFLGGKVSEEEEEEEVRRGLQEKEKKGGKWGFLLGKGKRG